MNDQQHDKVETVLGQKIKRTEHRTVLVVRHDAYIT